MSSPQARSPIDPWHRAHGARLVASGVWETPAAYAGVEREVAAVRAGCGLVDLSALAKWRITGRAVPQVVDFLGAAAARQPRCVALLNDGLLACRLAPDNLLLLSNSTDSQRVAARLTSLPDDWSIIRTEATSALAVFCLLGPALDQLLPRLTSVDPTALTSGRCAETAVAGVAALLVQAADRTVPAMRICVARDLAEYLWDRLLAAGSVAGLVPVGLEAFSAFAGPGAA